MIKSFQRNAGTIFFKTLKYNKIELDVYPVMNIQSISRGVVVLGK